MSSSCCSISHHEDVIITDKDGEDDKVMEEESSGCSISHHEDVIITDKESKDDKCVEPAAQEIVSDTLHNDSSLNDVEDMDIDQSNNVMGCQYHKDKCQDNQPQTPDTRVFSLYYRAQFEYILRDQLNDIALKNSQGITALDIARKENNWKAYRVLVDAGCREDIALKQSGKIKELKDSFDETTRQIGQLYEDAASDELNQREDLAVHTNLTNFIGERAVSVAAGLGDIFTLENLIFNGAVVTDTALINAVSNHHADCIARVLECLIVFDDDLLKTILKVPFAVVLKVFLEEEKNLTHTAKSVERMTIREMDEPILHKAVRFQNTEAVRCLVRAGADVNKCNTRNETALNIAVKTENIELIKELLQSPMNESLKEIVFLLSAVKHWSILKKCIDEGVDVNCRNSSGRTALMISVIYSNLEIFMTLLAYNANVNLSDFRGDTALLLASRCGKEQMVKLLLKATACVNCQNNKQKTPLMISIQKHFPSIFQMLINAGADIHIVDASGNSALSLACNSGDVFVVKSLLDAGAKINHKQEEGCTPLHIAVMSENLPIVKLLIESRAEINVQNKEGNTALIIACDQNYPDIVQSLLNAGANVNMKNNSQDNAMIIACRKNYSDIVHMLLNAKADVSIKDASGGAPLIIACYLNNKDIVHVLLEAQVDVNIRDFSGNTALLIACRNEHLEIVQKLVNQHADVNAKDNLGDTALNIACRQNAVETVQILLLAQAQVDVQNNEGDTALIIACRENGQDIVRILILAKANVNVQNTNGDTALIIACQQNNLAIVRHLLIAGAHVNVRNSSGYTAMTIARHEGFHDIYKVLNIAQSSHPETRSVELQTTWENDMDNNG